MGRIDQAMRRARQAGVATEFDPIPASADDLAVLAAEPYPAESARRAAVPEPPKADPPPPPRQVERPLKDVFFDTYQAGRPESEALRTQRQALLKFLEKVRARS